MIVLGIHDGHNAAACLLMDGKVMGAVQEERFSRIKNHDGFPFKSVEFLLRGQGIDPKDVDCVSLNGRHMPFPRTRADLLEQFKKSGTTVSGLKRVLRHTPVNLLFRKVRKNTRLQRLREAGFGEGQAVFIEHHTAHAAAAFWGSPWRSGRVLVLTCDAAGDDLCGSASVWEEGRMGRIVAIPESHSLGMVYAMVTFLMGMVPNEHEYKLMGLAPYCRREDAERVASRLRRLLCFPQNGTLGWVRGRGVPDLFLSFGFLRELLELERMDAVAGGLQKWTEEILTGWVARCVQRTGISRVALSGGVFMNVKSNQAIAFLPEVRELFVFPSCGDESNSFGAAFAAYADRKRADEPPIQPLGNLYLGPESTESEIEKVLLETGECYDVRRPPDITEQIADLLASGEIVARFHGRTEFGARALGNRSILADPQRMETVRRINEMIKSRDFWMPFAVSINREYESKYIHNPKQIPAPYMMITFPTTSLADEIRAGIHAYDETVRPQLLERSWNPEYHRIIEAFCARTGRGAVLNTSFNLHGSPIVNSPQDAMDVFARSGLQHVAIGSYLVSKAEPASD